MSSAPVPLFPFGEMLSPSYFAASHPRSTRFGPSYPTLPSSPPPYQSQEQQQLSVADGSIDDWPLPPPITDSSGASFSSSMSPVSEPAFFAATPAPPQPSDQSRSAASPSALVVPLSAAATATATATATPPSRKRRKKRRLRALDREQRLERRRAQHREVDAARRQKESEAMAKLHRLVREEQEQQTGEADSNKADATEAADDKCKKVRRLNILEASVALIERMKAASGANASGAHNSRHSRRHVASTAATTQRPVDVDLTLTTTPSRFDEFVTFSDSALPSSSSRLRERRTSLLPTSLDRQPSSSFPYLSILPPPTPSYVAGLERRPGPASFSSSLCVVIVTPLGVIVDVNERFLACTGWRRSDLLDTSVNSRQLVAGRRPSPLIFQPRQRRIGGEQWCDDSGSTAGAMQPLLQYQSFVDSIQALLRGETGKGNGAWRCWMRDGRLIECNATFWGETDERHDEDADEDDEGADKRRPPDRLVAVYSMDDIVFVDNVEEWHLRDH